MCKETKNAFSFAMSIEVKLATLYESKNLEHLCNLEIAKLVVQLALVGWPQSGPFAPIVTRGESGRSIDSVVAETKSVKLYKNESTRTYGDSRAFIRPGSGYVAYKCSYVQLSQRFTGTKPSHGSDTVLRNEFYGADGNNFIEPASMVPPYCATVKQDFGNRNERCVSSDAVCPNLRSFTVGACHMYVATQGMQEARRRRQRYALNSGFEHFRNSSTSASIPASRNQVGVRDDL
eukprot:gb/GECG01009624.1/.p1 GENE.gb/GECG01009624.1/~~gb/GECG01009624.1/.p1  ORF type:complete len:234 (+),score=11.06 gb/GECG01009624.1/:1-702(+)